MAPNGHHLIRALVGNRTRTRASRAVDRRLTVKTIALLSFRDEEPFLPYLLTSLAPVVDHVVALNDRSTDRGPDVLRAAGATVVAAPVGATFGGRRQVLLDIGRQAGGTHFIVLDADEAFTAHFSAQGRSVVEGLAPGEALALPDRTLWKGTDRYRVGNEYDMAQACIFCDDGESDYENTPIHESRLPGRIPEAARTMDDRDGSMAHFQFAAWNRAQAKQAWYRCKELLDGSSALRVNARYLTTLDGPRVRCLPMDQSALAHLADLDAMRNAPLSWHLDEVLGWFARYGPSRFEPLQIWHVAELWQAFELAEHRAPHTSTIAAPVARAAGDLFGSGRSAGRRVIRRLGWR